MNYFGKQMENNTSLREVYSKFGYWVRPLLPKLHLWHQAGK